MAHLILEYYGINALNLLRPGLCILMPFLQYFHKGLMIHELFKSKFSLCLAAVVSIEEPSKIFRACPLCPLDSLLKVFNRAYGKIYQAVIFSEGFDDL